MGTLPDPCDMISSKHYKHTCCDEHSVRACWAARAPVFCLCGIFLSLSFLGPLSEVPTLVSAWARLSRALSITVDLELIVRIM